MTFKLKQFAVAVAATLAAGSLLADTATFEVSASIASACVVGNTGTMAFGSLNTLDATSGGLSTTKNNATATFDATCTNGTGSPKLQFASTNGLTAYALKHASSAATIAYTLYEGTADSGTAIAHNTAAAFTGFSADGTVQSLSVTGQILDSARNGKPVGDYADTVTITATFTP